jgi:hypothetical protein
MKKMSIDSFIDKKKTAAIKVVAVMEICKTVEKNSESIIDSIVQRFKSRGITITRDDARNTIDDALENI